MSQVSRPRTLHAILCANTTSSTLRIISCQRLSPPCMVVTQG